VKKKGFRRDLKKIAPEPFAIRFRYQSNIPRRSSGFRIIPIYGDGLPGSG
jgi:hypothetical protein